MLWSIPQHCPSWLEDFARTVGRQVRRRMTVRIDPIPNESFAPYCMSGVSWDLVSPYLKGSLRPQTIWGPNPTAIDFVLRLNTSSAKSQNWQKVVLMHELGHAVDAQMDMGRHLDVAFAWQAIKDIPQDNAASVPLRHRQTVYKSEWDAWYISEKWLGRVDSEVKPCFYELRDECLETYAEYLQVKTGRPR